MTIALRCCKSPLEANHQVDFCWLVFLTMKGVQELRR